MLTILCFGDLWANKVSVFYNWTLKIKIKQVKLYRFGSNGLNAELGVRPKNTTCSHSCMPT